MVLFTYSEAFLHRKVVPWSWRVERGRLFQIPWVWFGDRAISLFFPCIYWHCGKLFLTILHVQLSIPVGSCQLAWSPYSSSWSPSKLGAQAQPWDGMLCHIPSGMVTCLWGFYRPSDMPRGHLVTCSSNPSLFCWLFSTGCSWFACLRFPHDRLFEGGTG